MKHSMSVFASVLLFAVTAHADSYQSGFGFSAAIPADWLVLSQQQLQADQTALNPDDPKLIGIDPGLIQKMMDKIKSGDMELYIHKGFGAGGFVNNINVIRQSSLIPGTDAELKETCDQVPGILSQYFRHPTVLYQCSLTKVAGKGAMLTEFDGALGGTHSIQYQIQKSDGATLVVTGTFTNGTAEKERVVFMHIVSSMKFQ
jgi:hypothetical protein